MAASAPRSRRKQRERKILLDLLRRLRRQKGLTQDQMATAIGAKQAFVSKYETGERRLDFLDLVAICEVLGISMVKFAEQFENVRKANKGPLADRELLRIYERVMDVMRQIQKEEIAPQMPVEGATGDTELDNEVND